MNNESRNNNQQNIGVNQNDESILQSMAYEDKVGKELYYGNGDPINNDVVANQFNNRSIEEKNYISNGHPEDLGYNVSQNPREIVAVHMEEGNLAAFKLEDGTILSKADAIELCKQGGIKDCNVGRRGSRETLRKNPVEDASKSLTNMPRF